MSLNKSLSVNIVCKLQLSSVCCPHKAQTGKRHVLLHRVVFRVDFSSAFYSSFSHLQLRMHSLLWWNKAAIHVSPLSIYFNDGPRADASLSSIDLKPVELTQILWLILRSVLKKIKNRPVFASANTLMKSCWILMMFLNLLVTYFTNLCPDEPWCNCSPQKQKVDPLGTLKILKRYTKQ